MDVLAVAASVVLGVVFLVAGASKLVAGDDWLEQARGLGAPRWLAPVVPWIEIVLGALLVTQVERPVVAGVAALMLIAFTGLILVRLSEGERPPCACFGRWSSRPLGSGHVVRNVLLVLVAAVAVLF
jgi:uncharacterized membrane protein YphA (DoxX/SURF4 family)